MIPCPHIGISWFRVCTIQEIQERLFRPQASPQCYGCECEYEGWYSHWSCALWRSGPAQMAVWCLEQWCHAGKLHGEWWHPWVRLPYAKITFIISSCIIRGKKEGFVGYISCSIQNVNQRRCNDKLSSWCVIVCSEYLIQDYATIAQHSFFLTSHDCHYTDTC